MGTPVETKRRAVHTLLGRRQLEVATRCLPSLLTHSVEPVQLVLHDDGTLDSGDWSRLEDRLGHCERRPRSLSDEAIEPKLEGHPRCLAFRRSNPLALKLLDVTLGEDAEDMAYCDADVLFLRSFQGIFDLAGPETGAIFMQDRQEAYSVRPWQLLRRPRLRLPSRVNTGIIAFRPRLFDLDFVEWSLGRLDSGFAPMWTEQTIWALLGGRVGCRLLDPRQVLIPALGTPLPAAAVALHWVSSVRSGLAGFALPPPSDGIVTVRSQPTATCGTLRMTASTLARRF